LDIGVALRSKLPASAITLSLVRLRSGPRVNGTTQYAQDLSQPSMIVMYARAGCRAA